MRTLVNLGKEELKQRCLELADELHEFLEDHALNEADRAEMMGADFGLEVARADIETMNKFRRGPKKKVVALLAELKRRGWWEPESLESEERKRFESPDSPSDVQQIAESLDAIQYK